MARKLRIHYPGALYHVILRGNAGDPVFFCDDDYQRFYGYLGDAVDRFGCRIHAFCCLSNHIHLALQVGTLPLSHIMQSLVLRYTQWIHLSRGRTGHLFQGRYKAILVDGETYLLELVRYIHLNPVRAGMAPIAEAYRWSGHRAFLGVETLSWLTTDWVLSLFSGELVTAQKRYGTFVAKNSALEETAAFLKGAIDGRILGDDAFAEAALMKAEQRLPRRHALGDVLAAVCRACRVPSSELSLPGKVRSASEARALAAVVVNRLPGLSLTDLARELDREISSLSKAARRLTEKARGNPDLAQRIQEVCDELR